MLVGLTHLLHERIVAILPCIGGDREENAAVVESAVVTYDEQKTWTVWVRVTQAGVVSFAPRHFDSFPKALKRAREQMGWG